MLTETFSMYPRGLATLESRILRYISYYGTPPNGIPIHPKEFNELIDKGALFKHLEDSYGPLRPIGYGG